MVPGMKSIRVVGVLVVLVSVGRMARAQDVSSRIAIESYSGPRPREAQRGMAALRNALTAHRFMAQPAAVAKLMGEQVPRPGVVDRDFTARAFAREIDTGENLYIDENYKAAVARLKAAIDRAHRNPEILREVQSRELKLKGLVLLAQSYARWSDEPGNKDAQAHAMARDEAMLEVHRSYPSRELTVKQFGPEGVQLWRAVADTPRRIGRGSLAVSVNDPDMLIYVDEIPRGNGRVVLGDLVPGPYRVLLMPPSGPSRLFTVTVPAKQEVRLEVDWEVASVLVVDDEHVGFTFDTEIARRREGELARRFAYRYDGTIVAVLTVSQSRRRLAIAGSVYAVWSGKLVRSGMVELGARDDAARIEQLASYLDPSTAPALPKLVTAMPAGDYAPMHIEEIMPSIASRQPVAAKAAPAPVARVQLAPAPVRTPVRHWHEIALVGAGLAAGGAGAYLVAIDGDPTCDGPSEQCRTVRDTGVAGWTLVAGGALAIGVGALLHLRHPTRPVVVAVPGPKGGIASAAWRF